MTSRERERRRRESDGKPNRLKSVKQFLLDLAFAGLIVLVIMGILTAYSGVWPPLVVVESGSMQHSDTESYIGVIDTGDLVIVKKPSTRDNVVDYVQGRATGYRSYGEFGDPVVYRRGGSSSATPVIHRALVWIQANGNGGWDLGDLKGLKFGSDWTRFGGVQSYADFRAGQSLTLLKVGYNGIDVTIQFSWFNPGSSGFITLGDHNNGRVDQMDSSSISPREPVRFEWIVGVAQGEIPCFGLIKLAVGGAADRRNYDLAPSGQKWCALGMIASIIVVPMVYDVAKEQVRRRKVERGELGEDEELEGPVKKLVKLVKRKVLKRGDDGEEPRRRRRRR